MQSQKNPYRGHGMPSDALLNIPFPRHDPARAQALLGLCPMAQPTPLRRSERLAHRAGVAELWIKDERERMGLGSFKALGASHAIAKQVPPEQFDTPGQALKGRVFVTASAGNHGLSLAAGARVFGARAVIYIAETVPEAFAELLRARGAEPVRAGAVYEESMAAAERAARENGWDLISDSSWPGYVDPALDVMEGYLIMGAEIVKAMPRPPDVIALQAGVGGLAAAMAAYFRASWGPDPRIIVVEPAAAPALFDSIAAGRPVVTQGPVSSMGRLDCKEPSLVALKGLARDADIFVTLEDAEVDAYLPEMKEAGFATSPSGGAGVAAVLCGALDLHKDQSVLCILSEGPVS